LHIFLSSLISLIICWLIIKLIIKPFTKYLPDVPNKRSSHTNIVPRGGGLAITISTCISGLIIGQTNFLLCLPLALVGLLDDYFKVSRKIRFAVQISTVFLILINSKTIDIINNNNLVLITTFIVLLIFGTAIINFSNFMDGIDGILAGCMIIIMISSALILSSTLFIIVSSLIGFIIWNWSPAKIFMGDIGSTYLGGLLVWVIFNTSNVVDSIGILFIATPILGDSLICLIRRIISKQPIFDAHSLHLYQRLTKSGWSHSRVSFIYICSSSSIAVSFILGGINYAICAVFTILALGLWLNIKYAKPFSINPN